MLPIVASAMLLTGCGEAQRSSTANGLRLEVRATSTTLHRQSTRFAATYAVGCSPAGALSGKVQGPPARGAAAFAPGAASASVQTPRAPVEGELCTIIGDNTGTAVGFGEEAAQRARVVAEALQRPR